MSSPSARPRLVSDLPAAQAESLTLIHDLARRAGVVRGRQQHAPELVRLDLDRRIAEITAASRGVPAVWINQAREYGTANREATAITIRTTATSTRVMPRSARRDRDVDMEEATVRRIGRLRPSP